MSLTYMKRFLFSCVGHHWCHWLNHWVGWEPFFDTTIQNRNLPSSPGQVRSNPGQVSLHAYEWLSRSGKQTGLDHISITDFIHHLSHKENSIKQRSLYVRNSRSMMIINRSKSQMLEKYVNITSAMKIHRNDDSTGRQFILQKLFRGYCSEHEKHRKQDKTGNDRKKWRRQKIV